MRPENFLRKFPQKAINMFNRTQVLITVFLLFSSAGAHASLLFEMERISDTQAIISGTGTLEDVLGGVNTHMLSFFDPFDVDPIEIDNIDIFSESTLNIGSAFVNNARAFGPGYVSAAGSPWIYVYNTSNTYLQSGDMPVGELNVQLSGGMTFAPVGSSGAVNWGFADVGNSTGRWMMVEGDSHVSVPAPASLSLIAMGLGLLGIVRRRGLAEDILGS
jgi:hypothetical protein